MAAYKAGGFALYLPATATVAAIVEGEEVGQAEEVLLALMAVREKAAGSFPNPTLCSQQWRRPHCPSMHNG